jgi:hypothetical protein
MDYQLPVADANALAHLSLGIRALLYRALVDAADVRLAAADMSEALDKPISTPDEIALSRVEALAFANLATLLNVEPLSGRLRDHFENAGLETDAK